MGTSVRPHEKNRDSTIYFLIFISPVFPGINDQETVFVILLYLPDNINDDESSKSAALKNGTDKLITIVSITAAFS